MVPFLRGQPAWSFPWRRVLAGLEGEGHLIAVDLVDYCGDANFGRRLYPLMVESGLTKVRVSPRLVYVDASRPSRRHAASTMSLNPIPEIPALTGQADMDSSTPIFEERQSTSPPPEQLSKSGTEQACGAGTVSPVC